MSPRPRVSAAPGSCTSQQSCQACASFPPSLQQTPNLQAQLKDTFFLLYKWKGAPTTMLTEGSFGGSVKLEGFSVIPIKGDLSISALSLDQARSTQCRAACWANTAPELPWKWAQYKLLDTFITQSFVGFFFFLPDSKRCLWQNVQTILYL